MVCHNLLVKIVRKCYFSFGGNKKIWHRVLYEGMETSTVTERQSFKIDFSIGKVVFLWNFKKSNTFCHLFTTFNYIFKAILATKN